MRAPAWPGLAFTAFRIVKAENENQRFGEVAVEGLISGDRILAADGAETTVRWLGEQPVNARLSHAARVDPIYGLSGVV